MPIWGLVVEQNLGFGNQRRMWTASVVGHVDGTREEALAVLRQRAEQYQPAHPSSPRRRALYQDGDGFLLVLDGAWQNFHCRFTVAEQLFDSAACVAEPPAPAQARAEPPGPPPEPDPPRAWDADVPEVPSWLGRDDLS